MKIKNKGLLEPSVIIPLTGHDIKMPIATNWISCENGFPKIGVQAFLLYSNGKISGGKYIGNQTWVVDFTDSNNSTSVVAYIPYYIKGE